MLRHIYHKARLCPMWIREYGLDLLGLTYQLSLRGSWPPKKFKDTPNQSVPCPTPPTSKDSGSPQGILYCGAVILRRARGPAGEDEERMGRGWEEGIGEQELTTKCLIWGRGRRGICLEWVPYNASEATPCSGPEQP